MIKKHEKNYQANIEAVNDKFKETEEQRVKREKFNAENLERIRTRLARKEYDDMCSVKSAGSTYSLRNELSNFKTSTDQMKEDKFVLLYGVGFITMMFLGFFSGYVLGRYAFRWPEEKSLIASLVVGTLTIVLEALLMIYRLNKQDLLREHQQNLLKMRQRPTKVSETKNANMLELLEKKNK